MTRMACTSTRRLGALGQHVASATEPSAPPTSVRAGPTPAPLSAEELQGFARDGFLVRQLTDVPPEFHTKLYADAKAMQQLERPWNLELTEIYDLFMKSGQLVGALTSILGPDFVQHPHRALHQGVAVLDPATGEVGGSEKRGGGRDQQFHKDGNHIAVRDHLPRWIMCMYYPAATTLEMGPTAVVRGSPYFTVDRGLSFPQAEDRLDAGLQPPPETPRALEAALKQWEGISGHREAAVLGPDAVDRRIDEGLAMLGGGGALEQRKLTVPAGSAVFIHFDIFHRGSRRMGAADGPWRPMFKLQFFRVSDPAPAAAAPPLVSVPSVVAEAGDDPTAVVWQTIHNWLFNGDRAPAGLAGADGRSAEQLRAALTGGADEVTRVAAAYALALRCNLGGGGDAAAAAAVLGGGLRGGRECVRRAAAYGLAQAGQAAVPVLLAALAAGLPPQAKVLALHALGQAAAEPGAAVADALAAAAAVALAELAAYAGPGGPPVATPATTRARIGRRSTAGRSRSTTTRTSAATRWRRSCRPPASSASGPPARARPASPSACFGSRPGSPRRRSRARGSRAT